MKPTFLKVTPPSAFSFSVRRDEIPYFFNVWHHHPEIELAWIREGTGTLFVGDAILPFTEGDMVLIGENLPHLLRSDAAYFQTDVPFMSRSTVIHFKGDVGGSDFWALPEMSDIKQVLKRAKHGFLIQGESKEKIKQLMVNLPDDSTTNTERLIGLLQILTVIAHAKDLTPLSTTTFSNQLYVEKDVERINNIYAYVAEHFHEPIALDTIAQIAHISPHAFCRYFKSKTLKTFSQFLLEVRVGHACKMLVEDLYNVNEICYRCGFNSPTNFNRYFKKIKRQTPSAFRQQFILKFQVF
jgi:AraC-like DNA-binding protein